MNVSSSKVPMSSLVMANVLYWVCAGVYSPFLSAYYARLGLDASQTGMLLAVTPLCAICVQPLWSSLADRLGKRKAVGTLLCVAAAAASLLYYLANNFAGVLIATVAFSLFFSALLPLCDSLVIDLAAESSLDFSRIRMGGTIGYAVAVFAIGRLLDEAPQIQFAIVSASLIVFALHLSRLSEPSVERGRKALPDTQNVPPGGGARGALSIFTSREIVYVLAFALVSQSAIGFIGAFLGRYSVVLGGGQNLVGLLSAVSAMSEIPILLVSTKLIERFGELSLLMLSGFMAALRLLLVGTGIVPFMIAGQLLQSVSYMTVYYSCVTYIANHVRPGCEARGQSIFAVVQSGLSVVIANVAGGIACDALGIQNSFYAFALLTVLVNTVVCGSYFVLCKRGPRAIPR